MSGLKSPGYRRQDVIVAAQHAAERVVELERVVEELEHRANLAVQKASDVHAAVWAWRRAGFWARLRYLLFGDCDAGRT